MTEEDFDANLGRTRRNLILISTLIFIHLSGAVTLNSEGNFVGVPIKLGNQSLVMAWLLTFNAYFLWRFFAYLQSSAIRSNYSNILKDNVHAIIARYVEPVARKEVEELKNSTSNNDQYRWELRCLPYYIFFLSIELWVVRRDSSYDYNFKTIEIGRWFIFSVVLKQNLKLIIQDINFSEAFLPLLMGVASFIWLFVRYLGLS